MVIEEAPDKVNFAPCVSWSPSKARCSIAPSLAIAHPIVSAKSIDIRLVMKVYRAEDVRWVCSRGAICDQRVILKAHASPLIRSLVQASSVGYTEREVPLHVVAKLVV